MWVSRKRFKELEDNIEELQKELRKESCRSSGISFSYDGFRRDYKKDKYEIYDRMLKMAEIIIKCPDILLESINEKKKIEPEIFETLEIDPNSVWPDYEKLNKYMESKLKSLIDELFK